MNRDAAELAMDEGRRFLAAGDLERAVRTLKRSYRLAALPQAAELLQEALRRLHADTTRYCADCQRERANCVCQPQDRAAAPLHRQHLHPRHTLTIIHLIGSAADAVMAFCDRSHAATRRFLEERVGVKRGDSSTLAVVALLIPLLAFFRFAVLQDQSIASWLFMPHMPLYRYRPTSSSFYDDPSSSSYSSSSSFGSARARASDAAAAAAAPSSSGIGGFSFSVYSFPILPSLLLTAGVNLFLWLTRRFEDNAANANANANANASAPRRTG